MTKQLPTSLQCSQCLAESFCDATKTQCCRISPHQITHCLNTHAFLIRANQSVTHFYIVKNGAFKKCITTKDGREHIKTFFLQGEIIGLDAIGHDSYLYDVITLTDHSQVCKIAIEQLMPFMQTNAETQFAFMKTASTQCRDIDSIPRNAHAKEKIAAFLLNIITRLNSVPAFLPMTRQDIGNYLGLTIETVSRIFTELKSDGVLMAQGKEVVIIDSKKLSKIAGF